MAYDPVKAHEYYMKYRKKGLLKGRKKGTSKKKSSDKKERKSQGQENLVGLSTSGLNEAGKVNWALKKKDLKEEMNAALAKATTPEQRSEIIADYHGKALQTLQQMRNDPAFAKAKAIKTASSGRSSGSKGPSSSGNHGGRDDKSSNESYGNKSKSKNKGKSRDSIIPQAGKAISGIAEGGGSFTSRTGNEIKSDKIRDEYEEQKNEIQRQIFNLRQKIESMTPEQKDILRKELTQKISDLKKKLKDAKTTANNKLRSL